MVTHAEVLAAIDEARPLRGGSSFVPERDAHCRTPRTGIPPERTTPTRLVRSLQHLPRRRPDALAVP
jgi:hypothetical protein